MWLGSSVPPRPQRQGSLVASGRGCGVPTTTSHTRKPGHTQAGVPLETDAHARAGAAPAASPFHRAAPGGRTVARVGDHTRRQGPGVVAPSPGPPRGRRSTDFPGDGVVNGDSCHARLVPTPPPHDLARPRCDSARWHAQCRRRTPVLDYRWPRLGRRGRDGGGSRRRPGPAVRVATSATGGPCRSGIGRRRGGGRRGWWPRSGRRQCPYSSTSVPSALTRQAQVPVADGKLRAPVAGAGRGT